MNKYNSYGKEKGEETEKKKHMTSDRRNEDLVLLGRLKCMLILTACMFHSASCAFLQ